MKSAFAKSLFGYFFFFFEYSNTEQYSLFIYCVYFTVNAYMYKQQNNKVPIIYRIMFILCINAILEGRTRKPYHCNTPGQTLLWAIHEKLFGFSNPTSVRVPLFLPWVTGWSLWIIFFFFLNLDGKICFFSCWDFMEISHWLSTYFAKALSVVSFFFFLKNKLSPDWKTVAVWISVTSNDIIHNKLLLGQPRQATDSPLLVRLIIGLAFRSYEIALGAALDI